MQPANPPQLSSMTIFASPDCHRGDVNVSYGVHACEIKYLQIRKLKRQQGRQDEWGTCFYIVLDYKQLQVGDLVSNVRHFHEYTSRGMNIERGW